MNQKVWNVQARRGGPYCEHFRCPRIKRKTGKCDGKCSKHGTTSARIGIKRARQHMKQISRDGGTADTTDSKSVEGNFMRVQVPLPAPF